MTEPGSDLPAPAARPPRVERAPRRRPDFAPLSGDLPARVRFAAWYFSASGVLTLVSAAVGVLGLLFTGALAALPAARLLVVGLGLALTVLTAASWLWTGRLLRAGDRRAALWAATTLLLPVVSWIGSHRPPTLSLVVGVIGALAVLSAWRELE